MEEASHLDVVLVLELLVVVLGVAVAVKWVRAELRAFRVHPAAEAALAEGLVDGLFGRIRGVAHPLARVGRQEDLVVGPVAFAGGQFVAQIPRCSPRGCAGHRRR